MVPGQRSKSVEVNDPGRAAEANFENLTLENTK